MVGQPQSSSSEGNRTITLAHIACAFQDRVSYWRYIAISIVEAWEISTKQCMIPVAEANMLMI